MNDRASQRNNNIDIVKGIACIAVCIIHFNIPENYIGVILKTACRFAVPYFFFVSGYFLLNKDGKLNYQNLFRKILNILVLLKTAGIFYFIFTALFNLKYIKAWNISDYTQKLMTKGKIVKFFVSNDPFVYSHLWFMLSLLYCYLFLIVIIFFSKGYIKIPRYFFLILSIFLLTSYTCLSEFGIRIIPTSFLIPSTDSRIITCNLFIFRGFSTFIVGLTVRLYQDIIKTQKIKTYEYGVLILGLILSEIERFYTKEAQMYIGTYIMLYVLIKFSLASEEKSNILSRILCFIGEKLSTYIYIYHIAFGKLIQQWTFPIRRFFSSEILFRLFQMNIIILVTILISYGFYLIRQINRRNLELFRIENGSEKQIRNME